MTSNRAGIGRTPLRLAAIGCVAIVLLALAGGRAAGASDGRASDAAHEPRGWEQCQGSFRKDPSCRQLGGNPQEPLTLPGKGREPDFRRLHPDLGNSACLIAKKWARKHEEVIHGVEVTWYFVWAKGDDYEKQPSVLVCGKTMYRVDGLTIGPGGGADLPCPDIDGGHYQSRPIPDGLTWMVEPLKGLWYREKYVHSGGAFGFNRDGYWNYQFRNDMVISGDPWLDEGPAWARLEGFCSY